MSLHHRTGLFTSFCILNLFILTGVTLHASWNPLPTKSSRCDVLREESPKSVTTPTICIVDESADTSLTTTGKRHSTGDASNVKGWGQHLKQNLPSTMSLESEGNVRRTEVTDI